MLAPNPHLPHALEASGPHHTRAHRSECGPQYYRACLEYSQALWLAGKPAQAILQIDKAFLADLPDDHPTLDEFPLPYAALAWFLHHLPSDRFTGNPTRHFQHLATRMSGPRSELRTHRAWACFHLSRSILPETHYPPDFHQISTEKIELPQIEQTLAKLPAPEATLIRRVASPAK